MNSRIVCFSLTALLLGLGSASANATDRQAASKLYRLLQKFNAAVESGQTGQANKISRRVHKKFPETPTARLMGEYSRFVSRSKLAGIVEEYKQMFAEQRYAEALVLAKIARGIAPNYPETQMMFSKAKIARLNQRLSETRKQRDHSEFLLDAPDPFLARRARINLRRPQKQKATATEIPDTPSVFRSWNEFVRRKRKRTPKNSVETAIQKALEKRVSLDFSATPLIDVLQHIANTEGMHIFVDHSALRQESVSTDEPITLCAKKIPLKSALKLMLAPHQLDFVIEDEVLTITSTTRMAEKLETRTYSVADLMVPSPTASKPGVQQASAKTNLQPGQRELLTLSELITSTIDPESWVAKGGSGLIQIFDNRQSLVVRQTKGVHKKINDLLRQVRNSRDLQVTCEVRFLEVPDRFFEQLGMDIDFVPASVKSCNRNHACNQPLLPHGAFPLGQTLPSAYYLQDDVQYLPRAPECARQQEPSIQAASAQASLAVVQPALLNSAGVVKPVPQQALQQFQPTQLSRLAMQLLMKSIQADARSNMLSAPKVTLFNGQSAEICSKSQPAEPGDFSLELHTVVSEDRRHILTRCHFNRTTENGGQATGRFTANVEDGQSVLVDLGAYTREVRVERGVPLLRKLPYLSRLFKNTATGGETMRRIMVVTPRIVVQEEEELIGVPKGN